MGPGGRIRPHNTKLSAIHRLLDAALVAIVYAITVAPVPAAWSDRDAAAIVVAALVFYEFANAGGLYNSWRIASIGREAGTVFTAWTYTVVVLLVLAGALDLLSRYPGSDLWVWAVGTPFVITAWHAGVRIALRQLRRRGFNTRSVGIVGLNELGLQLADNITRNTWMGFTLAGFFDDRAREDGRVSDPGRYPLVGGFDELVRRAFARDIDVVFVALPFQAEKRIIRLIDELRDTTASVYFAQDFRSFEMLHGRSYLLGDVPLVSVHENPFAGVSGVAKRIEDLVLGTLIVVLAALPMLAIAIGVKLSSPGPVLFRQRRYGLDGEEIRILKFRTMTVIEDGEDVPQARRDDPRVTGFGRILRRTSLDELPQFFNVLAGSMSIVGPRPHAVAHNEAYRKLVKSYMLRHKVKPGITGLAQINGCRGETATLDAMSRRVEYDLEYIRRWSVGLDLKIIAATAFGGFMSRQAY